MTTFSSVVRNHDLVEGLVEDCESLVQVLKTRQVLVVYFILAKTHDPSLQNHDQVAEFMACWRNFQ